MGKAVLALTVVLLVVACWSYATNVDFRVGRFYCQVGQGQVFAEWVNRNVSSRAERRFDVNLLVAVVHYETGRGSAVSGGAYTLALPVPPLLLYAALRLRSRRRRPKGFALDTPATLR